MEKSSHILGTGISKQYREQATQTDFSQTSLEKQQSSKKIENKTTDIHNEKSPEVLWERYGEICNEIEGIWKKIGSNTNNADIVDAKYDIGKNIESATKVEKPDIYGKAQDCYSKAKIADSKLLDIKGKKKGNVDQLKNYLKDAKKYVDRLESFEQSLRASGEVIRTERESLRTIQRETKEVWDSLGWKYGHASDDQRDSFKSSRRDLEAQSQKLLADYLVPSGQTTIDFPAGLTTIKELSMVLIEKMRQYKKVGDDYEQCEKITDFLQRNEQATSIIRRNEECLQALGCNPTDYEYSALSNLGTEACNAKKAAQSNSCNQSEEKRQTNRETVEKNLTQLKKLEVPVKFYLKMKELRDGADNINKDIKVLVSTLKKWEGVSQGTTLFSSGPLDNVESQSGQEFVSIKNAIDTINNSNLCKIENTRKTAETQIIQAHTNIHRLRENLRKKISEFTEVNSLRLHAETAEQAYNGYKQAHENDEPGTSALDPELDAQVQEKMVLINQTCSEAKNLSTYGIGGKANAGLEKLEMAVKGLQDMIYKQIGGDPRTPNVEEKLANRKKKQEKINKEIEYLENMQKLAEESEKLQKSIREHRQVLIEQGKDMTTFTADFNATVQDAKSGLLIATSFERWVTDEGRTEGAKKLKEAIARLGKLLTKVISQRQEFENQSVGDDQLPSYEDAINL